jgi:hypothetical protein
MTNYIITVFGKKGTGKTTLVKTVISRLPRVVVFDTLAEYTGGVFIYDPQSFIDYLKLNLDRLYKIVLRCDNDEDFSICFEACRAVYDGTLVVEEIDFYCSPTFIEPSLQKLIKYGRHRQINLIGVSRRAAEVNRNLTAQSDCIVTFQQEENRDIEYMSRRIGAENAESLRGLGKFEYRVFGDKAVFSEVFGVSVGESEKKENIPEDEKDEKDEKKT